MVGPVLAAGDICALMGYELMPSTRPGYDQAKAFAALVYKQGASSANYRCEPGRSHLGIFLDLADLVAGGDLGQSEES